MSRQTEADKIVLAGVEADGFGTAYAVRNFRHILVRVTTTGTTTATIKFAGSTQDEKPNFATTANATNHWDFVGSYDLNDPSSVVVGDTGIALSGADTVATYIINTDALEWFNASVSSWSQGVITVELSVYND